MGIIQNCNLHFLIKERMINMKKKTTKKGEPATIQESVKKKREMEYLAFLSFQMGFRPGELLAIMEKRHG
jgi:hypothetical protein